MFGREEQLRALEEGLAEAAAGRPRIALVTGEAGVGKTRLLQALEAEARSRGFLVLHGESVEFGGEELPYAPITAALRGLPEDWTVPAEAREPLDVLLPDPVPAAPAPAGARPGGAFGQARLYEVLLGLLARLATERAPVLIALEDLHWADRSTRNLLPFLARNLRAERIAVAVTYRTEELLADNPLRPLVAELIRRPVVTGIELEPLAPADAARQLEMIAGRPLPASLVADLHARTGGNPFFLEELFAAQEGGDVPRSIAETLLLRTRRLDAAAVRLLRLVAAAGGRIGFDLLDELVPERELPGALRAGLEAGILVREADDRGIGFRHALMSEVVYGELLPPERKRLHRAIARGAGGSAGCRRLAARRPVVPRRRPRRRARRVGQRRARGRARVRVHRGPDAYGALARAVGRRRRLRRRSTRRSCCRAPPRPPASRATASARCSSRSTRSARSTRRASPSARRCSTSGSASITSGTTSARWSTTAARWRCCPATPARSEPGCWPPRATR